MTNTSEPTQILAIDDFIDDSWFKISVVTRTEIIIAGLKKGKREKVLAELESDSDPVKILKDNSPLGQGPKIVPHTNIEALEWYDDAPCLKFHYIDTNKNKTKSVEAIFSGIDVRDQICDVIQQVIGPCKQMDGPSSIWYIGSTQLIISGITLLACGIPAIRGFMNPGPVDINKLSRRGRLFGEIYNALGATGLLLLGTAIIGGMMTWWYIACRNPPTRTIARPIRSDT